MNLKGWMDQLLQALTDDPEVYINYHKSRVNLPYAAANPRNKEIGIYANGPSLARLGIAHLIGHELAHLQHLEIMGTPGEDNDPLFQQLERAFINKIWELCLAEHEE